MMALFVFQHIFSAADPAQIGLELLELWEQACFLVVLSFALVQVDLDLQVQSS